MGDAPSTAQAWDQIKQKAEALINAATTRTFHIGQRTVTTSVLSELGKIAMGAQYISQRLQIKSLLPPNTVVVLGSGLGRLADEAEVLLEINFSDVPGFPRPKSVPAGHAGKFVFARVQTDSGPRYALLMKGRVHQYQDLTPEESVRYVRMLRLLGIAQFILTNAAGALPHTESGEQRRLGDLVVSRYQLPYDQSSSPFRFKHGLSRFGADDFQGFPTLDELTLWKKLAAVFSQHEFIGKRKDNGPMVHWGGNETLAMQNGPNYELPGMIRAAQKMGATLFGMSSVWELMAVLQGYHAANTEKPEYQYVGPAEGLIITNVTNIASGIEGAVPDHSDVAEQAKQSYPFFAAVIKAALGAIAEPE